MLGGIDLLRSPLHRSFRPRTIKTDETFFCITVSDRTYVVRLKRIFLFNLCWVVAVALIGQAQDYERFSWIAVSDRQHLCLTLVLFA